MTTPFPFVSAATLLASQLNAITTLATSTKTASHTLTISDVSTRVIMNSASATTITVNTSIFGASDVVEILNIGAGVCTVTAGSCTVGTSGSLALAQNAGGTLTFISASASVFVASGVTASAGGLTLISTVTSTAAAQILFDSVFSATYTNYLLLMTVKGSATTGLTGNLRLAGVTVSGGDYYRQRTNSDSTTVAGVRSSGTTEWGFPNLDTNFNMSYVTIAGPALAQTTGGWMIGGGGSTTIANNTSTMYHNVATAYDGIIILPASGTITGTSSIYGYSK